MDRKKNTVERRAVARRPFEERPRRLDRFDREEVLLSDVLFRRKVRTGSWYGVEDHSI